MLVERCACLPVCIYLSISLSLSLYLSLSLSLSSLPLSSLSLLLAFSPAHSPPASALAPARERGVALSVLCGHGWKPFLYRKSRLHSLVHRSLFFSPFEPSHHTASTGGPGGTSYAAPMPRVRTPAQQDPALLCAYPYSPSHVRSSRVHVCICVCVCVCVCVCEFTEAGRV
jgi:hypothetical protein